MVDMEVKRFCNYCEKTVTTKSGSYYTNISNGEVYYSHLICPECKSDIGDNEKIKQTDKEKLCFVMS